MLTYYNANIMEDKLIAEASINIDAPAENVWKVLTTPELIKKYLIGTTVTTDWKQGSAINYDGEYNGKEYHDKGKILKIIPAKLLQSTYWSSMGGKEDKPENYNTIVYHLTETDGKTVVRLAQDNVLSENEKTHVTANWKAVLQKLKEVAEATKN
jgi:uncharacterized protein YndB with AHSA1/START domain